MKEFNILESDEKKVFWHYLIPSMMGMLALSGYSFVDTFVVGQALGADAVAAMGLGTPVVSTMYALGFLFGAGGAVRYSVLIAQGKKEEAQNVYSLSFYIAVVFGIMFLILGNLFIYPIASFLGATAGNIVFAIEYLRWIFTFSAFMIVDLVLNNYIRNDGHPTVSAVATMIGTILNIILDFLFVMGFGWGMSGAASATCLSSVICVSINFGYSVCKKTNLRLKVVNLNIKEFPSIIQIGLGSAILEGAVAVITVFFLNAAGRHYGDPGVSAYSVILTFNLVVYSLLNGVAQAMQPIVSSNYGAGKLNRTEKFVKYAVITAAVLGIFFAFISYIGAERLCAFFVSDSRQALDLAITGLRYHCCAFIMMAISIQLGIFFQAKENVTNSFIILLGRSMLLPVVVLFILDFVIGENAVWISVPIGETIVVLLALLLKRKDRFDESCNF